MSSIKKHLICIVGPTAVGKTALAIEVAEYFQTEILSADSRQFYRELEIGTAKPNAQELSRVSHHFINSHSIHDSYDVGKFEKDALRLIEQLHSQHDVLVLVGGSGLFVNAVCHGLDEFPEVPGEVRQKLNDELEENGLSPLVEELKRTDPEYAAVVDLHNPQRVIRALEVIRVSGRPFSHFRKNQNKKHRPFCVHKIGLHMEREKLYERIDARMDAMIEQGLFEEAEKLLALEHLNALQTVGYQEIFPYLKGEYSREEAIRLLKRNSRRYAKRQLTWFRRDSEVQWFKPDSAEEVVSYLKEQLKLSETEC
ncbi:tRNA (adenosine(37)-N6)-dimethylallyltransferase MiaA [Roseivirga sp. UBA838]|uniref:tRNA (adenosine(37)-N6)-dimethylallyltransferase MiaA n=1 Tax=Roseivirga sp. UBA838 TaxID=1947393 RepID=UPI00257C3BDA|nr:tRNA (adenosine(37)-N6)-dimethylallyltransferase MiaA [Roseivirga sp. UBA838]|tara:strand:+ start:28796 stop:29728 length:933 start_codon:yes stop_codon:yes gene_type:complete